MWCDEHFSVGYEKPKKIELGGRERQSPAIQISLARYNIEPEIARRNLAVRASPMLGAGVWNNIPTKPVTQHCRYRHSMAPLPITVQGS
jgi:hypothetical protein